MVLPRFEPVHRVRLARLVADTPEPPASTGFLASCAAVEVELSATPGPLGGRAVAGFTAQGLRLEGWFDGRNTGLEVTTPDGTVDQLKSRRHGKVNGDDGEVTAIGAALTGRQFTFFTRSDDVWTARAKVHLEEPVEVEGLQPMHAWRAEAGDGHGDGPLGAAHSGPFGQFGLRDLHVVTHADGSPYERDGLVFLTATHAGPGFFDTAHCGVWSLDRDSFALEHRGNLWFRREGRDGHTVYGDHATHVVRHEDSWLVVSSTWGDFEKESVGLTLSRSSADLLTGDHVLDSAPLPLSTDHGLPLPVAGVWDPHLTLIEGHWHLAFVAARKFFNFYPALARASAPGALDEWEILGAATSRKATEGTIVVQLDDQWRVVASDGRENRPEYRAAYPVFDLTMTEVGALDAPYGTNLPWPSLIPHGDRWLLVTFDGTTYGGPLTGYGTHGDVIVMTSA